MQTGVIKRFGARGYGFIQPTDDGPAVFFHVKNCFLRNTYLQVGDRVEFELNQFLSRDGQRTACEVRIIPQNNCAAERPFRGYRSRHRIRAENVRAI